MCFRVWQRTSLRQGTSLRLGMCRQCVMSLRGQRSGDLVANIGESGSQQSMSVWSCGKLQWQMIIIIISLLFSAILYQHKLTVIYNDIVQHCHL